MRRHITRMMHQRSARQHDADLQPVGGRNKARCGRLGAGRVEQPGDIGARRDDPTRSPSNRSCAPYTEETVADRKARFKAALTERIEAIGVKDPGGVGRRLQRVIHRP